MNRKKATAYAVSIAERIMPGSPNSARIQKELDGLTDEQFHAFMEDLRDGKDWITLVEPNGVSWGADVQRNLALAEEFGVKFHERIWSPDTATGTSMLSNRPALVMLLPDRRQQQHLTSKYSIADDSATIDELTGQPTGDSKTSAISFPQALINQSRGLGASNTEFYGIRGGNPRAFEAANRQIMETGSASIDDILQVGTRAKSTESLGNYFWAQHLENNA